jgi:hypothetical protein
LLKNPWPANKRAACMTKLITDHLGQTAETLQTGVRHSDPSQKTHQRASYELAFLHRGTVDPVLIQFRPSLRKLPAPTALPEAHSLAACSAVPHPIRPNLIVQ